MKINCTHNELYTNTIPFYQLDRFERLIHVSGGEVEAEVQHGISGGLVTVS